MTTNRLDDLRTRLVPVLTSVGLDLYDVELSGSGHGATLRVLVDREGGVDLDTVADATRALEPVLDADTTIAGSYTLEVSSPGVERPLRRPEHYHRAIGDTVSVKARNAEGTTVRVKGTLTSASDSGFTVATDAGDEQTFTYEQVTQAHTVFEWGPTPKQPTKRRREAVR